MTRMRSSRVPRVSVNVYQLPLLRKAAHVTDVRNKDSASATINQNERLAAVLGSLGLQSAALNELHEARAVAERLIGPSIVSLPALERVHRQTRGGAVFVHRSGRDLAGVLAFLPLSRDGLDAIQSDRLDARAPAPGHVAKYGDEPEAVYLWGGAGSTRQSSAVLIRGAVAVRDDVYPLTPFYSRAATPDGARLLTGRLGYRPLASANLFWSPPRRHALERAA